MRAVYIYCPGTGLAVATGMIATEDELKVSRLQSTIDCCPACQGRHYWTEEDAWLAAERAPARKTSVPRVRRPMALR